MSKQVLFFILFLVGFGLGIYIVYEFTKNPTKVDPIAFSHYVHTKEHKIKCVSCHRGAKTQERAGIPNVKLCSTCHSTLMDSSSAKEKVIYQYVKKREIIPWKIYYHVPDYVNFSHRRHVNFGKLDCVTCHGDMREQTSPELKNFTPVKMQVCFQCHEEKKITTDCGNCHH